MLSNLRFLALVLLAVWALAALAIETADALSGLADEPVRRGVFFWRMGTEDPARLAAFLEPVGAEVPPGGLVVFATGDGAGDPEFFQRLWAAYLLPRHRVIGLSHPRARAEGEYLAAYGTEVDHPRAAAPRRLPGGVLYRVLPPP